MLCLSLSGLSKAQTASSSDLLKKENSRLRTQLKLLQDDTTNLHEKLKYCQALDFSKTLEVKGIGSAYNLDVLSCKGDRESQTVKIEFVISHQILHQDVCLAVNDAKYTQAIDELGNEYPVKSTGIGTSANNYLTDGRCNKVPTDTPVKGYIVISSVMPSTQLFRFVSVMFKYRNFGSEDKFTYSNLEIRSIKVTW
jgi:hypothetical protein